MADQPRHPMSIALTPYQSVMIHGWARPSSVLAWRQVESDTKLTWSYLRTTGLSAEALKRLQPDPAEWVRHGEIKLHMLPDMLCFPVHPIRHLKADISELWQLQLPSHQLEQMGVTYSELVDIGLTPEIMARWSFSLTRWRALGFCLQDLGAFNERDCFRAFHIPRHQAEAELRRCTDY
eukprot:763500-Hanusia_phi.AAC.8